jgi:hypothetical protein
MTRRLAVRIGLILVLTVAPSSRASAQGASGWILWEKNMATKNGADSTTWEPLDGFATIAECRLEGQRVFKNALAYMNSGAGKQLGPVRPDGRSAIFDVSKDGVKETLDIRLLCFPGSLDPRPRPTSSLRTPAPAGWKTI